MAKIYSPNKTYTGVSASVSFCNGVGETDNLHLLQWFKDHGYKVEETKAAKDESEQKESGKSKSAKASSKETKSDNNPKAAKDESEQKQPEQKSIKTGD